MDDGNPLAEAAREAERVAVVHHWDADGIASAALVIEEVRRVSPGARAHNLSPTIGRWALDEGEVASLRGWGPDLLVIVDLAVRDDDLDAILDGLPRVPALMVDHHRAEVPEHPRLTYWNPVAEGRPETDYPSCSWVLREMLGRDMSFREAFVRATGDTLERAEHRFFVREALWHTWVPFLTSSGVLWGAITALAIVAIRRRKTKSAAMRERWDAEEALAEEHRRSTVALRLDPRRPSKLDDLGDDDPVN